MIKNKKENYSWVVGVDMGYGHQRTAYPLRELALGGRVINANHYSGISEKDRRIWKNIRVVYEFLSNFKKIPFIGEALFAFFDKFQKIMDFYPKRDLSASNFQLGPLMFLVRKGWGKHLIEKIILDMKGSGGKPRPFISTFFMPAFMAEQFNYPGEIFCVICDADVSRTWVALDPYKSKIKYFAPTQRVVERLQLYGVNKEKIFLTGYPLPLENIGSEKMEILKNDLRNRIKNLDFNGVYSKQYGTLIKKYLGKLPQKSDHPLTIMFSVGGAGAQREMGVKILKSLASKIKEEKLRIILSAGTKSYIREYFIKNIEKIGLAGYINGHIKIISADSTEEYFKQFNEALRTTDILWTKPSELSFYTALGLPIIISPTVGSQEDFNREWLLKLGSAVPQEKLKYTDQWLCDLLNSGWFAEAAMQGFIEGEKKGVFNIKKIISGKNIK
ncbi:MAG: hypothetical protein PHP03_01265 [Candidatus Pacebacteria bacterium]|nr:hypothetical protein [Candidatus Paceibacterota bacterium]